MKLRSSRRLYPSLAVTLLAFITLVAVAQAPIEPLRRSEEKPGSYSLASGAGVYPLWHKRGRGR